MHAYFFLLMMTSINHFFYLPVSPWPLILSINSFNLLFSLVIFLKFSLTFLLIFSLLVLFCSSFFWWSFYSCELNLEGLMSSNLVAGIKFSFILFIFSEVFFFFSFFWCYFHFFLSSTLNLGFDWPPFGVAMFDLFCVPILNTFLLVSSGFTVTLSHLFLNNGNKIFFLLFLFLTLMLGFLFSFFQYFEYNSSFFSVNDSNFGSIFFVLTGFHGIHVLLGSGYLLFSLAKIVSYNFSIKNITMFELSCWYWHFVDLIWLFLFYFVYYLTN